jgi:hypothetical protein
MQPGHGVFEKNTWVLPLVNLFIRIKEKFTNDHLPENYLASNAKANLPVAMQVFGHSVTRGRSRKGKNETEGKYYLGSQHSRGIA